MFPKYAGLRSLQQGACGHGDLHNVKRQQKKKMKHWKNHTSSLVSDSAVRCWQRALRASYIRASVSREPISHLSRREMKILKGRDSEYSPEGVNISL